MFNFLGRLHKNRIKEFFEKSLISTSHLYTLNEHITKITYHYQFEKFYDLKAKYPLKVIIVNQENILQ